MDKISQPDQWIQSLQKATFTPPPPPRLPHTQQRKIAESLLLDGKPRAGFTITAGKDRCTQILTLLYPCAHPRETIVLVLDTLTHMHKHDLSPFLLNIENIGGQNFHTASFVLPRDLLTSAGIIRTNRDSLPAERSQEEWKHFFDQVEPLVPLAPASESPHAEHTRHRPAPLSLTKGLIDNRGENYPLHRTRLKFPEMTGEIDLALFLPEEKAESLLILTDGSVYLEDYPILSRLQTSKITARTAVLFLSPSLPRDRAVLLGTEKLLSRVLKDSALAWAAQYLEIPDPTRCIIAGGSLGGLAAAQLLRVSPDIAQRAIVQSASLWWNEDDPAAEGKALLDWAEHTPYTDLTIFLEVGSYEGYLLSWNRAFRDILRRKNIVHTYREYTGGHDYACWREGLIDGLIYFLTTPED